MKNAEIAYHVEFGIFDDDMSKLVDAGRKMFRCELLEQIAREKIKTLSLDVYVDEIEVYLGYQYGLREKLGLTSITPEMRFFNVSGITDVELEAVEFRVKMVESSQFPVWFAQWHPWHKAVERLAPAEWKKANDVKIQYYDKTFKELVENELEPEGLTKDEDAIRDIGAKAIRETEKVIFESLMTRVLESKASVHLLNSPWGNLAS